MDYIAFTDESYITANRYRSISSFSMPSASQRKVESDLNDILKESSVREFKWEKLKDAKYKFCAVKIINYVLKSIRDDSARIDVVIWDTHDSRHTIRNRSDSANFERMFFHLLSTSMKRRPKGSSWGVYPDEKSDIDWKTISDCLAAVGRRTMPKASLFIQHFFDEPFYHIKEMKQVESHTTPFSQVADLFAGISVFSKDNYEKYSKWLSSQSSNLNLFDTKEEHFSNRENVRFEVMKHLDNSCKSSKLGVSLKSKGCFHTPKPSNPVNFWPYRPQHENDKAPTK